MLWTAATSQPAACIPDSTAPSCRRGSHPRGPADGSHLVHDARHLVLSLSLAGAQRLNTLAPDQPPTQEAGVHPARRGVYLNRRDCAHLALQNRIITVSSPPELAAGTLVRCVFPNQLFLLAPGPSVERGKAKWPLMSRGRPLRPRIPHHDPGSWTSLRNLALATHLEALPAIETQSPLAERLQVAR